MAESYANRLTAFTALPDGGLADRRVWADLGDGVPDGLPHRSCTRVRAGGEVLDRLELDHGCFACALSDDTLYLVTQEWRGLGGKVGRAR